MSQNDPKISIVTPSYNQAHFLEQTILSVLNQQYPDLEYIIVDGGSTDASVEIIKRYAPDLHFWRSEPDSGHYDAVNKGFSQATGEIMAWLNSDDMYFPWTLKTVASIMTECPEVEWLTSLNPCFWDWNGFCVGTQRMPGYSREAFLDGGYLPWGRQALGWIQQESTFWKRSLWNKVGGTISLNYHLAGDFDLWTHFYDHAELYGTFSPLAGFRYQQSQRGLQKSEYEQEAERSLHQMRIRNQWSSSRGRQVVAALRLYRMPKLRKWLYPLYSYTGKRITRIRSDTSDGHWAIEDHDFFHIYR